MSCVTPGFDLTDENRCEQKRCKCELGPYIVGSYTIGANCPEDGSNFCDECSKGYYLDETDSQCYQNRCECLNGVAAETETPDGEGKCETDGNTQCVSCSDGYFMNGGKECQVDCGTGYHLRNGTCDLNICDCNDGMKAFGVNCVEHGTFDCSSCNDGFDLIIEIDLNGNQSGNCELITCNTDFYLSTGFFCLEKVCVCENGVGRSGTDCHTHGAHSGVPKYVMNDITCDKSSHHTIYHFHHICDANVIKYEFFGTF